MDGNQLLSAVIDAHGGMDRWKRHHKVEATIVSGGGLFRMKGMPQDPTPRRMTVWLHEQRASVTPFGAADQRTLFTSESVAIEKTDGRIVGRRDAARESFVGHQLWTPWDALHRAYFNGYALWLYLTTPFVLMQDDVVIQEIEPWVEGKETWRVLRAHFPGRIATHNRVQDFYFGEDLLLRRHDYNVNIVGGLPAAQLTSDYIDVDGLRLPTKRRAYARSPDRQPISEMLMVSIDIAEVAFT